MIFGHKRTVFSIIAEYRIVNYRILTLKRPFLNGSYRNIFLLEIFFQRFYRDFIKVEKRRRQNSVRLAYRKSIVKMLQLSRSARCDNGNTDTFGDSSCKLKVVALFLTVAVHTRQEYFACAALFRLSRPKDRVNSRGDSSAV